MSNPGNTNFKAVSSSKIFNVNYPTLELKTESTKNPYPSIIELGGYPFASFYETSNHTQYDRGVYVELDTRGLEAPPYHKIIKATFYFNNYDDSTYTKTVTDVQWHGTIVKTSLVNGYTPYKAIVYYSLRTATERRAFPW